MRQVGDTLVWLSLIAVVAAVLYLTPRFASYLSARERDAAHTKGGGVAWQIVEDPKETSAGFVR